MIECWLDQKPVPKGNSPRIMKRGRNKRWISPSARAVSAQEALVWLALQHAPPDPLEGPLRLDVVFVFKVPGKSRAWPQAKREAALFGAVRPTSPNNGDRDNLHKLLADALAQAGWYFNDAQLVEGDVSKRYGPEAGYKLRLVQLYALASSAAFGTAGTISSAGSGSGRGSAMIAVPSIGVGALLSTSALPNSA